MKDGIMLVDKESGPSSFQVVERIEKLTGARKAGHAGTLDPFATGLLVVLLNQGTKLCPFLMAQDKVYRAELRLGIETDTGDLTGAIIEERGVDNLTEKVVKEKILGLVGAIKQVPPRYSAIHYQGRRAYELAREGVEFVPPERKVRIHCITIVSIDLPVLWIEVGCSSGTYIRSLASELGRRLGTGAHLTSLRRMKSGLFHVDMGSPITEVSRHIADNTINELIIPLKGAVSGMNEVEVHSELAKRIRNGYMPRREELDSGSFSYPRCYCKAVQGGELVAIMKESNNGYEVCRVFT